MKSLSPSPGWLLATSAALIGCSHSNAPANPVIHRTAGDTTFVSSPALGVDSTVHLVETTRIDAAKLDFGRIDAGAFGPNGSIWLYDSKGKDGETIRVLDSLGTPVILVGHSGEGPGEYRGPLRIFQLANGSMLVKEMTTVRAIRFGSDGQAINTIELPPVVAAGWVVTPDPYGGWYLTASFEQQTPTRVGRFGWLHFSSTGTVIDTLYPPRSFFDEPTPDGIAPGRIRTPARDRTILTAVPGSSQLLRIDVGHATQVMEWRADPPAYLPQERIDMQAIEDKMNELLGQPKKPLPERKEAVHRILTDDTGMIWALLATPGVRIPDDELPKEDTGFPPMKWREHDRWAAFNSTGVLQFVVDAPAGAQIIDRSGRRILGLTTDASGMQSVVVWKVTSHEP